MKQYQDGVIARDAASFAADVCVAPAEEAGSPTEHMDSTDVEVAKEAGSTLKPSRGEWWMTTAAFFGLGTASVFAWSHILHMLPYVTNLFLDKYDAGNSLLGAFHVGNLTVQCALLRLGTLYEGWLHIGLFLGGISYAAFGPCVFYGSTETRIVLIHVLCLILGIGSGFLQGCGFSVAAIMPDNQVSVYSVGQGFAAIVSILLIGVFAFSILDVGVAADVAVLIHITAAATAILAVICMALSAYVLRQPAAKKALTDAKAAHENHKPKRISVLLRDSPLHPTEANTDDKPPLALPESPAIADAKANPSTEQPRPLHLVIWSASVPLVCVFVNFFITVNLFPRVGPIQWRTANPPQNYLIWLFGIFPFGDTFGRCLCFVDKRAKCLGRMIIFPEKLLPWVTSSRVVLYVLFFLSKHLTDSIIFNAFWFQCIEMVLVSASHGWLATISLMYCFNAVPSVQDKQRLGPMGVLCLIFGLLAGLYLALLYR